MGCWTVVPGSAQGYLVAVTLLTATDGWAVGTSSAQTLIEHWDGTAWTAVPSPNVPGVSTYLTGVAAVGPADVWAVGDYYPGISYRTLFEHWDGTAWTIVPSPPGDGSLGYLNGVAALAANDVWAAGQGTTGPLIEHWDGAGWSVSPAPTYTSAALDGIAAVAANDIWAVGTYFNGSAALTLTLHWNGSAWTAVPSPSGAGNSGLQSVTALAGNDVWAVGGYGSGLAHPLRLHWDGTAWTLVPGPDVTNLFGVAALAADDIWAVGQGNDVLFAEHWDGSGWRAVLSPAPGPGSYYLYAVAAVAPGTFWAVGEGPTGAALTARYAAVCPTATPTLTPTATVTGTPPTVTPTTTPRPPTATSTGCPHSAGPHLPCPPTWTPSPPATNTPTVSPSRTGTPPTQTPPRPTATSGAYCGLTPTAASANCAAPATYNYSFSFYTFCAESHEGYGSIYFEASTGPASPWTVLDQQDFSGYSFPSGTTTTLAGSFTENAIPPQYTYYHVRIWVQLYPFPVEVTSTTDPAPLCAALPTQTPGGPSATPNRTPSPPAPTSTAPAGATVTPCSLSFSDVHPADYFYTPVLYLACHGVISGYGDGTYRPYSQTTRAQQVKIVVLGFQKPITTPSGGAHTFADVPPAFPFFAVIETAAAEGIVSGYGCGGPGEPCDPQGRPYFRPYANVTRGQLAKITVAAANWPLQNPPVGTFADVAPGGAFYPFVETAACHGIISGYGCDGPGEPCDPARRPYFRPSNSATRGQIAKIVYGALTAAGACGSPAPVR